VFTRDRMSLPARSAVLLVPDDASALRLDPAPASGETDPVEP
jgi:hypothetical protein